jgi:hypothetical protein
MNVKVIGIDPGLKGALAVLEDGCPPIVVDMPVIVTLVGKGKKQKERSRVCARGVTDWLKSVDAANADLCIIEAIEGAAISQTPSILSIFGQGHGVGILEACVTLLDVPFVFKSPLAWKHFHKVIAPGLDDKARKAIAIAKCDELLPETRKMTRGSRGGIRDGRSEALLIALYAKHVVETSETKFEVAA